MKHTRRPSPWRRISSPLAGAARLCFAGATVADRAGFVHLFVGRLFLFI
jgi:hypothetical protein